MSDPTQKTIQEEIRKSLLISPFGVFVQKGDTLTISSYASVTNTIRLEAVVISLSGQMIEYSYTHTPNTDRSLRQDQLLLPDGRVISATVNLSSGTVRRGQLFLDVEIKRGASGTFTNSVIGAPFGGFLNISTGNPIQYLFMDYLASGNALSYPGSFIRQNTEGPGYPKIVSVTNPAAGAEWSLTVPTGARWRIIQVEYLLTTSTVAGNRASALQVKDTVSGISETYAPNAVVAASGAVDFDWYVGSAEATITTSGLLNNTNQGLLAPIPYNLFLKSGDTIGTVTQALSATDTYTQISVMVEEWIEV